MKTTKEVWVSKFSLFIVILIILCSCEKKDKVYVPEIVTLEVSNITQISATSGGKIINNGGAEVTERGLCWSEEENPTIVNTRTEEGTGSGSFTSIMSELEYNTTYFVRAYASNSAGTAYGNELSFTTDARIPELTTFEVSNISQTSATSGGEVSNNGGAAVTERGLCWSKQENPSVNDNYTEVGPGTGSFTSTMSELERNTTYYVRAYATNSAGIAYGNELSFSTGISDADGNIYPTVIIGNQEWFAENLRTTRYNDNSPIPTGHSDQEWKELNTAAYTIYPHSEIVGLNSNAEVLEAYGALYNWYAVETGKVCPDGWHVPTYEEWRILEVYAGGLSIAGGRLKSARTYPDEQPRWGIPNTGATDEYGFSALPGGYRHYDGTFYLTGEYCNFWSSSSVSMDESWGRRLSKDSGSLFQFFYSTKHGFSIRCVKD
jgi:uncharacterized protein (TIGR02145 family)